MSVFKIPTPHPNLSRNGFDLSSRRVFSNSVGQLLPVGCWEVNPGEKFRISVQDLVRTQPLNTAAFARCKEYFHFFFVPYPALWMYSDSFFTGVVNPDSTARRSSTGTTNYDWVPKSAPYFDLDKILDRLSSSSYKESDVLGYKRSSGAYKLLHYLGYGINADGQIADLQGTEHSMTVTNNSNAMVGVHRVSDLQFDGHSGTGAKLCIFRLLAYQRIYNDFYRNQQWEKPDVESFNLDWLSDDSLAEVPTEIVEKVLTLRYRQWNKDLITSSIPTPNYNEGIFDLPALVGSSEYRIERSALGIPSLQANSQGEFNSLSPTDLRAMFALDKMLEATRRAHGLDYQSQIAAHFGFDVPESRKPMSHFIGGFDNAISIGEVIATASGTAGQSSSVVGQVTGKGIGSLNSHAIDFTSKEHGIIMCIHSVVPQPDYNAIFVDAFNTKINREDYFQPEFQDLGYVPLKASDLAFFRSDTPEHSREVNNKVLGYVPRYHEYKTARDVVFGDFISGKSLSAWTTPRWDFLNYKKSNDRVSVDLSASNFMIDPGIMDSIFAVDFDGDSHTDQFLVNSYFNVMAVRPMSVTGLAAL